MDVGNPSPMRGLYFTTPRCSSIRPRRQSISWSISLSDGDGIGSSRSSLVAELAADGLNCPASRKPRIVPAATRHRSPTLQFQDAARCALPAGSGSRSALCRFGSATSRRRIQDHEQCPPWSSRLSCQRPRIDRQPLIHFIAGWSSTDFHGVKGNHTLKGRNPARTGRNGISLVMDLTAIVLTVTKRTELTLSDIGNTAKPLWKPTSGKNVPTLGTRPG